MPTKTEEIIKGVSNTFQVSTDQILQQSLTAFLEHPLRTVEAEVLQAQHLAKGRALFQCTLT